MLISLPDIMLEGADYQLTCDVINVAPVQNLRVTWSDSFRDIETQTFNETASAPVNVSSFINVTAKREYDRDYFWCNAELHLGPDIPNPHRLRFNSTVVHCEFFPPVHHRHIFQEGTRVHFDLFAINQIVQSSKIVRRHSVAWRTGSTWTWCPANRPGTLQPPFGGTTRAKWSMRPSLSTERALEYMWPKPRMSWEPAGSRSRSPLNVSKPTFKVQSRCVGALKMLFQTPFLDKPSFSCEPSYEVAENEPLRAVCKPGGLPGPVVSWVKDGKELNGSHQWQKEDSGDYLVRATNKHGTAEHQLYLHVLCMFQHSVFPHPFPLCTAVFPAVPLIPFLSLAP